MLETSLATVAAHPAGDRDFIDAVLSGLSQQQKTLPCRYFYDARGSDLFELITKLPEYYLTRCEAGLLEKHAAEIVGGLPPGAAIIEFGAGSSRKMEPLLRKAREDITFIPVDVSRHALVEARVRLSAKFPQLTIQPVVADFAKLDEMTPDLRDRRKLAFFLGSTIGNLDPGQAVVQLRRWREAMAPNAELIVGVDLAKDRKTVLAAYNDAAGITAEFNLNILRRINRDIEPAFDVSSFWHSAVFNEDESRIEMHLVSRFAQVVRIRGQGFEFTHGESIHTENSYKHSLASFRSIAAAAGWHPGSIWTDGLFSLHQLT